MQFEEFDNKIKEAADHHHPAYDENAWARMENLLNKHLPQKKDNRRRFIFFLLFFLLLGGGAWLLISKPWQQDKRIAVTDPDASKNVNATTVQNDKDIQQQNDLPGPGETNAVSGSENNQPVIVLNNTSPVDAVNNASVPKEISMAVIDAKQKDKKIKGQSLFLTPDNKNKPANIIAEPDLKNKNQAEAEKIKPGQAVVPAETMVKANEPVTQKNLPVSAIAKQVANEKVKEQQAAVAKTDIPVVPPAAEKKSKNKTKKSNSFFISLSAGPDISFVSSGKPGTVKLLTGAGLGFTFKDKFTIRTGFYSARKIYTAKPSDYKAPPEFYQFYPYLEKVDANCRVFEIPVSLSYSFGKSSPGKWFVSAGLSSFLMNEETYNYFYKYTPSGNTYTNQWAIKNKNSHFFSVGTVSGGYKTSIGNRVTLMAEPYIKIPFGGVGYGKVKLNSGGVLFTAGIKLF